MDSLKRLFRDVDPIQIPANGAYRFDQPRLSLVLSFLVIQFLLSILSKVYSYSGGSFSAAHQTLLHICTNRKRLANAT
jgi:hypothetical protein